MSAEQATTGEKGHNLSRLQSTDGAPVFAGGSRPQDDGVRG